MITSVSLTISATRPNSATILRSSCSSLSKVRYNIYHSQELNLNYCIGWKRVLLADGPRQTINGLTLYAIYLAHKDEGNWYDVSKYFKGNSLSTSALTVTTFFTVVVFAGSLLLLIVAGVCYIPLLAHIRGNLKVISPLAFVSRMLITHRYTGILLSQSRQS